MKKTKRLTPLSHREFKHGYEPTANPKIVATRLKAEKLIERIKKEKDW